MFDATKLPTEPVDPAKLAEKPAEPAPQYARAPAGNGHQAALKEKR